MGLWGASYSNIDKPAAIDLSYSHPPNLEVWNWVRKTFRVGNNTDAKTVDFCKQDSANLSPEENMARSRYKRRVDDTHKHSLLRVRRAIPESMRTGRFLNFGIGQCDSQDPMAIFFHNDLSAEEKKTVNSPEMHGYGFEADTEKAEKCWKNFGGPHYPEWNATIPVMDFLSPRNLTDVFLSTVGEFFDPNDPTPLEIEVCRMWMTSR